MNKQIISEYKSTIKSSHLNEVQVSSANDNINGDTLQNVYALILIKMVRVVKFLSTCDSSILKF